MVPAVSTPSHQLTATLTSENLNQSPAPDAVHARVTIDPNASLKSFGFGGGGTFTLVTPAFSFGNNSLDATSGTVLPLDFIQNQGFSSYSITSYKTAITPNKLYFDPLPNASVTIPSSLGGYDAFLDTQTLTIGAGQTLTLRNKVLPSSPFLDGSSALTLKSLASGGDLNSIFTPTSLADTPQHLSDYG